MNNPYGLLLNNISYTIYRVLSSRAGAKRTRLVFKEDVLSGKYVKMIR